MWVAPTVTLLVTYFLYVEAGYAGVLGIIPVLIIVPLQGYTGKLSAIYRKKTALKTDERVRLMDEIISGVQVIKMYAWEKPFEKLIKFARKAELKIVLKSGYVRGLFMTFNLFTARVALFCSLLTMALTNQKITAAKVFVLVAYFNVLSQTISSMFVRGVSEIAELFVTISRLEGFMMNHEFEPVVSIQNINHPTLSLNKNAVSLKNLTAKWNATSDEIALNNINLNVPKGSLTGIIGPVGSGKSSLLQAILGELNMVSGDIEINGSLSYASQEPWVFATTFPDSDQTIVGERGASLSGGQKARISLARAVYRNADIYLLDDPLSAVDIHVSKHLYNKCINGYLAKKTRILVTHQVHHLKNADHIIILKNGEIENEGNFVDLSTSDNLYAKLLTTEPEPDAERQTQLENGRASRKLSIKKMKKNENIKTKLKDMQEESSKGKIAGSLFWKYLISGGNFCFVFLVFLLYALAQAMASGVDYFVSFWVDIEETRNISLPGNLTDEEYPKQAVQWSTDLCLYIYGGGIVILFILLLMAGSLILVAFVNPQFLILMAIIIIFFLILRHIYLKSSKNIKRLEGIMRSPVFTHLNVTLQGLTTIRAFGVQDILKKEFDKHQDHHSSVWFMFIAISSAFGLYLDLLCSVLAAFITFSFLTFGESLGFQAGEVGLAITQATTLTFFVQWGMRQSAEVVNQLMSVERILEYTILPKEIQPDTPKYPPKTWPQDGQISLNKMGLKYIDSGPQALRNLNVTIKPKEKIGIVGRTGAGKSSLISALFRLATVEGEIEIDGIDTKDLYLKDLRSRISIIPQDPVLFSGTLRYNLDPFEEYTDDILYKSINDVELKDPANLINRLENRRGLLLDTIKFFLLDEATANVDPQTDALIQKTIRTKFADCTVLTVAHRLNTIMDSDKILVMDSGTMVEFDHPHILLQNKNGTFYKMVEDSSRPMAEQFKRIARECYQNHLLSVPE
ncbi:hypothetical protein NQ314_006614 [Rhamnusium bicolor]|uniref:Uncharacterized protein n=1 Tax=Rhamnusium bicolor TaxID=1586634 RepID=A0AAV8YYD2_9CUCU|nr:hypothetical protein NQ314_006614 [Rhamnusium bicolor]